MFLPALQMVLIIVSTIVMVKYIVIIMHMSLFACKDISCSTITNLYDFVENDENYVESYIN
jgi:hypothetical protein